MQALHDVVQSGKVRCEYSPRRLTRFDGSTDACARYWNVVLLRIPIPGDAKLCQDQQDDLLYQHAALSQCHLQRRGARNVSYPRGALVFTPNRDCGIKLMQHLRQLVKMLKVGSLPWSPLARGYLARPYADQSTNRASSDRNYARFVGLGKASQEEALQQINKAVETIALARGVPMAAVSLAWSMQSKGVSAPIVGTTNLKSLEELVRGASPLSLSCSMMMILVDWKQQS